MIFDVITTVFFGILTTLFSVFPSFPAMPQIIIDGWEWFSAISNEGIGLLVYLLSEPLYYVTITMILFMTTFEYIYHFFIRFVIFRIFMGIFGR